jgi:hypothetical protein
VTGCADIGLLLAAIPLVAFVLMVGLVAYLARLTFKD